MNAMTMAPSMRLNMIAAAVALLLLATSQSVSSFQLHRATTPSTGLPANNPLRPITSLHSENPNTNKGSDMPSEEEVVGEQYEGSVDWDAEWKKVVEDRDQPVDRPGKYKTQAEIAAIQATNKVAKNVFDASRDMKASMPSPPSIRSLQGDWRFWIGIIAIVSFGLSILSATSAPVNESFYI